MSSVNEDFSKIVYDIAAALSLKECRYTCKKFDSMAQNYFGVLIPVHLSGKKEDRLSKAKAQFDGTDYVPLLEILLENCVPLVQSATSLANKTCICHGDIWKENILFKYQSGVPILACLIDYQTARVCSPAFDMLYLIISSTDTNLRKKYFFSLLDIYYQTIEQMLNQAGFEAQSHYSRQTFESDLKIVCPAVFILANTGLWLANGMQQEGHVRSKLIVTTEEDKMKFAMKYKTVIKDIIDDLYSYGYLNKELTILGEIQ